MGDNNKKAAPEEQHTGSRESIVPQNGVSTKEIVEFFRVLYSFLKPDPLYVTIWTMPDKRTIYFPYEDINSIADACLNLRDTHDVYYGVALRNENLGEWERGKSDAIGAAPGVWLDVDFKGGSHKATNLPSMKEVAPFLTETFGLKPTMLVNSGYGFHVYWLFDDLLLLDSETKRNQFATLLNQFQQVFIQAADAKGWKLDNTSDTPRVLRVAGTYNRKNKQPTLVKILGSDAQRRYSFDVLEKAIAEATAVLGVKQVQQQVGAAREIRQFTPVDGALPSASQVLSGCGFIEHCASDAATLTEPEWYKMLTVIARTDMGAELAHDLSRPYPGYTEKETDTKIQHALSDSGPITCEKVQADHGDSWCRSCVHNKKIKSPISLGMDRVQSAKKVANEALAKARSGDVGAALEAPVVGALALIAKEDPADFARLKVDLKKAKVPLMEINKAIKQEKRRDRLRLVQADMPPEKQAGDMLEDCPLPELVIPTEYTLSESDGVHRIVVKNAGREDQWVTHVRVANHPILVTGIYRDINTREESLRLGWKKDGNWFSAIIKREEAANQRSIVSPLARIGAPVTSGTAGELIEYLARLEADNLHRLPIAYVTNQLGWQGKDGSKGFLVGRKLITGDGEEIDDLDIDQLTPGEWRDDLVSFRGTDHGDEQLADGFHSKGTIEAWMEAIKVVSRYPKPLLAFYTAFVPPLLQIIRCEGFVLEYAKRTSTGKSVSQRVAASVMGNPDERSPDSVFHTWAVTQAWLGRALAVTTGLPFILDDTKRAKSPEFVAQQIYNITSGRDTGRGTVTGLSATRTWRTVVISSGEVKSTSFSNDGGIKGRVLEITSLPFDGDGPEVKKMVERLNLTVSMNYGHAMPLFLKWVMKNKEQWLRWEEAFRDLNEAYASRVSGTVAGRLAKYAAAIDTAAHLVHAAFRDMGHALPFDYSDPFANGLWESIAKESEDATGEEDALRAVAGWAMANETSFLGRHQEDAYGNPKQPNNGWIGKWDQGEYPYLAIFTEQLKRYLRSSGHDPEQVFSSWKERGWLVHDRGYQKQIRFERGKAYMICISREAIEREGGPDA